MLAYLDADCIAPGDWLKRGAALFRSREVVGVSGPIDYYDAKNSARFPLRFLHRNVFPCLHYLTHEILHAGGLMIGGNAFLRADKMEEIGGFDTTIAFYGDDTDTACRLAKTGRLLFKGDLVVRSSARRFQKQGYLKITLKYFSNFLWVLLFKRPFYQ
jgi:GT2 family glycosyltransferase